MRALVKAAPEPGLRLQEIEKPAPSPDEVLIRVLRTGLCGTDLHIESWDDWAVEHVPTPLIVGHEFVGRIEQIGERVADLNVGDIVSGEGHLICGRCRNCMAGRRHLCANTKGVGVNHPGAFADYMTLPASNVWRHSPTIDLDVAAIFDPFGNAVHTALEYRVLGEDVLITGAGPIGVMAAAVVRHAGARHVVITDVNRYRLDLAQKVGVTKAVDVSGTTVRDVQAVLDMSEGFDVGLEMSGHPTALPEMIANMAHGGKIALLGLSSEEVKVDWSQVIFSMLTLKGIYGRQMFETWYWMSVLVEQGLDLSPVITHRFPAEAYADAFATVRDGHCGKVILDWSE